MWLFLQATDWISIAKQYGLLGVFCFVMGALVWKGLLPYIQKQHEQQVQALQATIEDGRKERDYSRLQREREATAFIQSLKVQGDLMKEGFDEVLHEIRNRRK